MKQPLPKTSIIVSLSCLLAGFYLLAAIFINVLGYGPGSVILDIASYPGKLLFRAFFLASFYIPLFVFGCGFLLLKRPFNKKYLGLLVFSIAPFLTFSLLLKLVSVGKVELDVVSAYLYRSLGVELSGLILCTLLVFEFYIVFRLVTRAAGRSSVSESGASISAKNAELKNERKGRNAAGNESRKLDVILDSKPGERISGKRELILSMNRVNRMLAEKKHEEESRKGAKPEIEKSEPDKKSGPAGPSPSRSVRTTSS